MKLLSEKIIKEENQNWKSICNIVHGNYTCNKIYLNELLPYEINILILFKRMLVYSGF